MDTSAITYRVADFLKKHPPFQAIEDVDLLELAQHGRVRFHEARDFILWQGEPHKLHVFVIQQGTVSLWDETDGQSALRDVRGPGDMLGIERFTGARSCEHTARAATDVVIYAFPAEDFEERILKYPHARQFVQAYEKVTADYRPASDARDPQTLFLHDVIGQRPLASCPGSATIAGVARSLLETGSEAVAIVDGAGRAQAVVSAEAILAWVAAGGGTADQPISEMARTTPRTIGPALSVIDGVLALAECEPSVLAMTADGTPSGQLQALVTPRDIARAFGDQPIAILREIGRATGTGELLDLNRRARGLVLKHLTDAGSVDWVSRFASLADQAIVRRLIALLGPETPSACWCFCGASGRAESLTQHAPQIAVLAGVEIEGVAALSAHYERVSDALGDCGYMTRTDLTFDREFLVAGASEWRTRYEGWLRDPVRTQMYRARPLFDLLPVQGPRSLWQDVEATVAGVMDRDFLQVLANDCLASLPPLTFYQDAVVEESGQQTTVFRLEHSALRPLVDVGRVFGMATKRLLGTSTRDRFASARTLLPEHESIFREASETLRILLWQQARIGITRGTDGAELPPALLSRHDRHMLKSGFRSILRLLEFTGHSSWIDAL